jgi:hypothetical protein
MSQDIRQLAAIYRERHAMRGYLNPGQMFPPSYETVTIVITGNVGRLYAGEPQRNIGRREPMPWFGNCLYGTAARQEKYAPEYRATLRMWQGEMTYRWRRIPTAKG